MFWDICGAVSSLILSYLVCPGRRKDAEPASSWPCVLWWWNPQNIHADVERQAGGASNAGLAQSFIKDDSYGCG